MAKKIKNNLYLFLTLLLIVSCGNDPQSNSNQPTVHNNILIQESCAVNSAVIIFYDGLSQTLCGCLESNQERTFQAGEELTCTIKKNTAVTFLFKSKLNKIKLSPKPQLNFPEFPLYNPQAKTPLPSFAYIFSENGIFHFQNIYNHLTFGKITVLNN
jgi:hypothetical protein